MAEAWTRADISTGSSRPPSLAAALLAEWSRIAMKTLPPVSLEIQVAMTEKHMPAGMRPGTPSGANGPSQPPTKPCRCYTLQVAPPPHFFGRLRAERHEGQD